MNNHILIGEVARMLKLSVATLRTWEKVGKLLPAGRTSGGRRFYSRAAIVEFIKQNPDYLYGRYPTDFVQEAINAKSNGD